jgi:hypothetical protein
MTAPADERGISRYLGGQFIAGAVSRVEPGEWVELRNQQSGHIIDGSHGIAAP